LVITLLRYTLSSYIILYSYISSYIRNSVDYYGTEEFILYSISAVLNMNVN